MPETVEIGGRALYGLNRVGGYVNWATPQEFYTGLVETFGTFDLDPCCTHENAKTKRHFTQEEDGLVQTWTGRVFANPPFGNELTKWVTKAYQSSKETGAFVVMLVPMRPDTQWFHRVAWRASQMWIVEGRVAYNKDTVDGQRGSPAFPSMVVVFDPCDLDRDGGPRFMRMSKQGKPQGPTDA